jgi:hypothetical protein
MISKRVSDMKRKTFVSGLVIGALLGGVLTISISTILRPIPDQPQTKVAPMRVLIEPPEDDELPPNTQKRFFNGQPYYVVPLAMRTSH